MIDPTTSQRCANYRPKHLGPVIVTLLVLAALTFAGCVAGKNDQKIVVAAPSGSHSIAVAVVDQRNRPGCAVSSWIGTKWISVGGPCHSKNVPRTGMARDLAEAVVRGFGPNRKLAPPMWYLDDASARAALQGTGTERQILIRIERFNPNALFTSQLDYSLTVEVYDGRGRLLASDNRAQTIYPGKTFWGPDVHQRRSGIPTGRILSDLLSSPRIRSLLN